MAPRGSRLKQRALLLLLLLTATACDSQGLPFSRHQKSSADQGTVAQLEKRLKAVETQVSTPPREAETLLSFQKRTVNTFPLEGSTTPMRQVADQWVFHLRGKSGDGTFVCVDDEAHCIDLKSLREQLLRPSSDPLGILAR